MFVHVHISMAEYLLVYVSMKDDIVFCPVTWLAFLISNEFELSGHINSLLWIKKKKSCKLNPENDLILMNRKCSQLQEK